MTRSDTPEQPISKLDVARRQLVTALRLFFDGRDPVSICTLAHAAREVLEALCRHRQLPAFMDKIVEDNDTTLKDTRRIANYGRNFFKHANEDPEATLDDFYDGRNDGVLFVAIQDLKTLCNNRLPIEAQAFEAWFAAAFPDKLAPGTENYVTGLENLYPEFRSKSRDELKLMTRDLIQNALNDESVMLDPKTDATELPRWK
jgi:hypothetical protein